MGRKAIPDEVQQRILTRSRRRCCLCFWLTGRDEVQKGQIAHLDQDNENPEAENLAFLCFDHHDEYDGVPRLAKGLREGEVRHWRDELYKEMEHRFHSFKKRAFELSIVDFIYENNDLFSCEFQLKNAGEVGARSPHVAVRLPDNIEGGAPERFRDRGMGIQMPVFEPWAAGESQQDIFDTGGRVMIWELGGLNPVLMPDHAVRFRALTLNLDEYDHGSTIELEYRVDAEDCTPALGILTAVVPPDIYQFKGVQ